jgi:hypothetical protein
MIAIKTRTKDNIFYNNSMDKIIFSSLLCFHYIIVSQFSYYLF